MRMRGTRRSVINLLRRATASGRPGFPDFREGYASFVRTRRLIVLEHFCSTRLARKETQQDKLFHFDHKRFVAAGVRPPPSGRTIARFSGKRIVMLPDQGDLILFGAGRKAISEFL